MTGALRAGCLCLPVIVADAGSLEHGRWLELPHTKLVDSAPQPLPPGVSSPDGVMTAWCGGALDSRRDRLLVWGGGHAAYSGNEIYAFDPAQRAWSIVWGPTPNQEIPNVKGAHETYLDGNPGSRHTYDNLVYDPESDALWTANGSLWRSGSRTAATWRFLLGEGRWERLRDTPKPDIYTQTAYDPERKLIVRRVNRGFYQYDARKDNWRQTVKSQVSTHWDMNGELDPVARKFIMVGGGRFEVYDLDSHRFEQLSPGGDAGIVDAKAPGLAWHPASGGIVAWGGGKRLYLLKIENKNYHWTAVEPDGHSVAPTAPNRNGTYGRFQFVESANAFVLVNNARENVFLYRLGE